MGTDDLLQIISVPFLDYLVMVFLCLLIRRHSFYLNLTSFIAISYGYFFALEIFTELILTYNFTIRS